MIARSAAEVRSAWFMLSNHGTIRFAHLSFDYVYICGRTWNFLVVGSFASPRSPPLLPALLEVIVYARVLPVNQLIILQLAIE